MPFSLPRSLMMWLLSMLAHSQLTQRESSDGLEMVYKEGKMPDETRNTPIQVVMGSGRLQVPVNAVILGCRQVFEHKPLILFN